MAIEEYEDEYEEFEDNYEYEPEDTDEDDDKHDEHCPYCGNGICSSDADCPTCAEHVAECAVVAGLDPKTGEAVTFTIIALF